MSWSAAGQLQLREAVRQAANGAAIRYDEQVKAADGRILTIDVSIVRLPAADIVKALVSSAVQVRQQLDGERTAQALAELTRGLAKATSVHDVAMTVVESGCAILQATRCRVGLWDRDRRRLVFPTAVAGRPENELLGAADRQARAGPGTTISVGDCTAAAPLRTPRGELFAVLDLGWPGSVGASPAWIASLRAMVDVCGQALQRAIAHDAQDALVRALQRELLPAMPVIRGLELSARYLPACDQLAFGGDWYDAIPLGPTTTALVIGDMVGHDARAAARMARVRGVLNALIQLDHDPGNLFARAFDVLGCLADPFIGTAAVFVVDTATDVLTFASAGHPEALLRTPDGKVALLAEGHGPALGLPPRAVAPGRRPFGVGSTLLAYTDGLVERRGRDLDAGIQAIATPLQGAPFASSPSADEVLDRILRASGVETYRRDDVAAVVIRRT